MLINKSSRSLINIIGVPSLLIVIVLGDNFYNLPIFSIFVSILLVLGAKEIPNLVSTLGAKPIMPLLISCIILYQLDRFFIMSFDIDLFTYIICITLFSMIFEVYRNQLKPLLNISVLIFSFIWLGLMLGSLSELRNLSFIGFRITIILFLSVWICDSFAFYFGKNFGIKKILPSVSPNKTYVGTFFGFVSSILFLLIINKFSFFNQYFSNIDMIVIGIITGGFGQLGDWAESLLKREAGLKDSSHLLMGHGGILDRFDSLSFAAPLTLMYCKYFLS